MIQKLDPITSRDTTLQKEIKFLRHIPLIMSCTLQVGLPHVLALPGQSGASPPWEFYHRDGIPAIMYRAIFWRLLK
jgi:hypothetical protein